MTGKTRTTMKLHPTIAAESSGHPHLAESYHPLWAHAEGELGTIERPQVRMAPHREPETIEVHGSDSDDRARAPNPATRP